MTARLRIQYEGYWQCRQATDPDPTRDKRGASGYTFAIGDENDLDEIIRLHLDEIPPIDFREAWPPPLYPDTHALSDDDKTENRFGVFVTGVELDGASYPIAEQVMRGGKVRGLPVRHPTNGPWRTSRNARNGSCWN